MNGQALGPRGQAALAGIQLDLIAHKPARSRITPWGWLACFCAGHPAAGLEHTGEVLHGHERMRCRRCGARVWR